MIDTNNTRYFEYMDNMKDQIKLKPEVLRKYEGCENVTDEEANEIINSLHDLSIIVFKSYQDQIKNSSNEEDGEIGREVRG